MTNDLFENQSAGGKHGDSHLSLGTVSAYLDGELAADARTVAEAHLATCQLCQDELQSIRATTTLMRSLPDLRPARSFQLGREYAEQAHGATSWLARMLGLMPALRAATAVVALLLVVVVAGDVLTNNDNANQERHAVTTNVTSTAPAQIAAPSEAPAPTNAPGNTLMIESGAATEPASDVGNAAPAGAAAPNEAAKEESETREAANDTVMQVQESGAADEGRAAEPEGTEKPAAEPAALAPTLIPEPSPTLQPTPTPQPTATAVPSEASGTARSRVSNWRIAEIALGLLLAWLIVTLVGLRRLRRD